MSETLTDEKPVQAVDITALPVAPAEATVVVPEIEITGSGVDSSAIPVVESGGLSRKAFVSGLGLLLIGAAAEASGLTHFTEGLKSLFKGATSGEAAGQPEHVFGADVEEGGEGYSEDGLGRATQSEIAESLDGIAQGDCQAVVITRNGNRVQGEEAVEIIRNTPTEIVDLPTDCSCPCCY